MRRADKRTAQVFYCYSVLLFLKMSSGMGGQLESGVAEIGGGRGSVLKDKEGTSLLCVGAEGK